MKLYWKKEGDKHFLMAEPAAKCLTLEFRDHRWYLTCLGDYVNWSGNLPEEEIKDKALEWFRGAIGRLDAAIVEIQNR